MRIIKSFQQGSIEWAQHRVGCITMSNANALLTGGKGKTRMSYIYDVISEKLSGEPRDRYRSVDMEAGTFFEDWAIRAFQAQTDLAVETIGFAHPDDERIGCSPDGLIGTDSGIEIKCPKPRQHINNIFGAGFNDYQKQIQGCMWVCERESFWLVSFCPWVKQIPIHMQRFERDEEIINALSISAIDAADTVEEFARIALDKAIKPEVREIAAAAKIAWNEYWAENSEVKL